MYVACVMCVCVCMCVQVRSQLSKNDRKKFNAVLIVDVHNRDIIDGFVRDRYVRACVRRSITQCACVPCAEIISHTYIGFIL